MGEVGRETDEHRPGGGAPQGRGWAERAWELGEWLEGPRPAGTEAEGEGAAGGYSTARAQSNERERDRGFGVQAGSGHLPGRGTTAARRLSK